MTWWGLIEEPAVVEAIPIPLFALNVHGHNMPNPLY